MPDAELERHLQSTEEAVAALRGAREADRYARALGEPAADEADLDEREARIWAEPGYQAALQAAAASGVTGEALARAGTAAERRLDLHRRALLEALVRLDPDAAPLARVATRQLEEFRHGLNDTGTRVDRLEQLRREPDRDVREGYWLSLAPLGELVEPGLVRLIEARNRAARHFGCDIFPDVAFEAAELGRLEFMSICDEVEQLTRPAYEQFLAWCRQQLDGYPLEPWDLDYFLATLEPDSSAWPRDDLPATALRLMAGWGAILETDASVRRVEMNPAGQNLSAGRPDDVRVLLNSRDGLPYLEVALREMGQALHRRNLPLDPPAWRWECGIALETQGALSERLSLAPLEEAPADQRTAAWRRWRAVTRLRRRISDGLFETLIYEQPTSDLHGLYSEIQEHYLGYSRHPERLWATVPSLVTRPVGLPNIVLGVLAADQIAETLRERNGGTVQSGSIAATLRGGFQAPGARIPWETRLKDFTGRPLDPDATFRRLGVDSGS